MAASLHFVSAEPYAARVKQIVGKNARCIVVGALSLDNINNIKILDKSEFYAKWGFDPRKSLVLITIHPETTNSIKNVVHCKELIKAFTKLAQEYQLVITSPNADTNASVFRQAFNVLQRDKPDQIKVVDNFGTQSYFSCMFHANYMLGNTSSGIIEAASFKKYVINIGDRQKGRLTSHNIINVPFNSEAIIEAAKAIKGKIFKGKNIYIKGNAAQLIIKELNRNGN